MRWVGIRGRIALFMVLVGMLASTRSQAAAFQLFEQDGASIGNYHAGYAAAIDDASTAYYNPAGLTLFQNQQVVFSVDNIFLNFNYTGNIAISTINDNATYSVNGVQGGHYAAVPAIHYVAPINHCLSFGFSILVPFGLKTDYGDNTLLRFAATETSLTVVDMAPALGWQLTQHASLGIGFDVQKMFAEFDSYGGTGDPFDSDPNAFSTALAKNTATSIGYGYHLGWLYQFTPNARIGVSYHSRVRHHLTGHSRFTGSLAELLNNGESYGSHADANMDLPAFTAVSFFYRLREQVAIMASAIYTQWNTFQHLELKSVSGVSLDGIDTNLVISIPQYFRNTWNLSLGANFYPSDKIIIRTGLGYDQTPVSNRYRNVQLPDNNRFAFALGGHFQANRAIGIDVAWAHIFSREAIVHPPTQVMGIQEVNTMGTVTGDANIYALQLTWDFV